MSETGFRIFNSAFSIGAELIYAVLLTAFFKPFMSDQGRKWRKLFIVFSVYILFEIVCNRTALPQGSFGPILMVMLLAVSKWIDLEKSLVFLLTLLYLNARISSGSMVQSLYFIVERSLPFQLEPPEAVFLRAALLVMLFLLSHTAMLAVMLYALQRQMRKQRMTLHVPNRFEQGHVFVLHDVEGVLDVVELLAYVDHGQKDSQGALDVT